jgi:hypothetical protein
MYLKTYLRRGHEQRVVVGRNAINCIVMPALVAGIYVLMLNKKTWMAGTSPAMTASVDR